MKTEPNWNEAPEGATHCGPENDDYHSGWYKESLGKWFAWDGERKEWGCPLFGFIGGDRHESLVKIPTVNQQLTVPGVKESLTTEKVACSEMEPTTWNGQGLPPVGVCEALWSSPDEYYKVNIIAHDDNEAVYRWLDGPDEGIVSSGKNGVYGGPKIKEHYMFRPLKTEREYWIDAASEVCKDAETMRKYLGQLYDATIAD